MVFDPAEAGLVVFQDENGHERPDTAMLDAGASAYLCGYGPFRNYVNHLRELGFPLDQLTFSKCYRKFHFGGDAESWCRWTCHMPVFLNGKYGTVQCYLIPGDTPMLMGRPIIEALELTMDFGRKALKYGSSPWEPAVCGLHGEYLLPLTSCFSSELLREGPNFQYVVPADENSSDARLDLEQFDVEEKVFYHQQESIPKNPAPADPGLRQLKRHQLRTCEVGLASESNLLHSYVTQELHEQEKPRLFWEVYCGGGRTSDIAESLGMTVERFDLSTGWNFDLVEHQEAFKERVRNEMPHEILIAPECKLWSQMQNLAAQSEEQQWRLQQDRQWHHDVHLKFVRDVFLLQVNEGRHCHLEQPRYALSWRTSALKKLPGHQALFDQCAYGCCCLDVDGEWRLVKKPTCLLTSKLAVAQAMSRRCSQDHEHCHLEGHAPGYGRRTAYLENYQPILAAALAGSIATPEIPRVWDHGFAVNEQKVATGSIVQLMTEVKQDAVRTVQRLHRNLGHPSPQALYDMLESRGASTAVLDAAKEYRCVACLRYHKPNKPSPSNSQQHTQFGATVQADVMWIKVDHKKIPILSMVDMATKYQVAALVLGERSDHLIHALERCWVRHFGLPLRLCTDEGRGWCSDQFSEWTTQHDIIHEVAPGEAHTRLSVVERRHQILRKAIEVFLHDLSLSGAEGVKQALTYVLPQLNAQPTVAGFSPAQWVLGKQPTVAGELLGDHINPRHLQGDSTFEDALHKRAMAKTALIQAETDQKLRRALLRRYSGTNSPLRVGQLCYYWRDARQADLVKIRWHGPARILLREDDEETGSPTVYWLCHKTQLLRCAPHHVRADFRSMPERPTALEEVEEAKKDLRNLKSRGVTRYRDLSVTNKADILDLNSDEEGDPVDLLDDEEVPEPPLRRPRLTFEDPSDEPLMIPEAGNGESFSPGLADEDYSPSLAPASPTLLAPPATVPVPVDDMDLELDLHSPTADGAHPRASSTSDEPEPSQEPSAPPTRMPSPSGRQIPFGPLNLDSTTASLYERVDVEDFSVRRRRFDQQETLPFAPTRHRGQDQRPGPYSSSTPSTDAPNAPQNDDLKEILDEALMVEELDPQGIPEGWQLDEQGFFQLDKNMSDWWEVRSGCLIRHHVVPRRNFYILKNDPKCPIDPSSLDVLRVTLVRDPTGNLGVYMDNGSFTTPQTDYSWTGQTIYQICGKLRKEMAMYSKLSATQVAKQIRSQDKKAQDKKKKNAASSNNLSERHMSLSDREAFQQAKMKELQSFFQNSVWEFSTASEADPSRTLSSRMLLKWSRNPDGSPRAKARLIVRGYADVDALEGKVDTAAPTTSRLSRAYLLSLLSNLQWSGWTADVSTAFLQGLPQTRKLWVKLPAECLHLLGADENTRMFLKKPCYGQIDAPRRWYLEAVRRLTSLGFRQHLLDPCCFMLYEADFEDGNNHPSTSSVLGQQRLCGLVCIHVDDLLGAGNVESKTYQRVVGELKQAFNFREWKEPTADETTSKLEYCGASLEQYQPHCWKLHHSEYFKKVKPIPLAKGRNPEDEMTSREVTQLRGLLGSLQWPAVQSSPHIQCSTSLISGSMSAGLVKSIMDANRLLRFCKENADVGAKYEPLGPIGGLRLVCMFDAAFGVRRDSSSQGGYLIMLVPQETFEGTECPYHLIDWKSSKLPRIARSSLGSESQAAGQAVDALDFCCRFWEHLLQPDLPLRTLMQEKSSLKPIMITDAKALYDSYHREGLGGGVTDKRTGLEIRVTKERLGDLDGTFKWISSERQYADGLTKEGTRQLLADRLRHGKIKFTWDPLYIAAKKKKLSDRVRSRDEFAQPSTHNSTSTSTSPTPSTKTGRAKKLKKIEEEETMENYENEENPTEDAQHSGFCAGLGYKIKYVNVLAEIETIDDEAATDDAQAFVENAAIKNDLMVDYDFAGPCRWWVFIVGFYYQFCAVQGSKLEQCDVEGQHREDDDDFGYFWWLVALLLLMVFVFGVLVGRWSRSTTRANYIEEPEMEEPPADALEVGCQTETEEPQVTELERLRRRSRRLEDALRVLMTSMVMADGEMDRFKHIRDMGREIIERMFREVRAHAERCPMNDHEIYLASRYGTVWHRLRDCGNLRCAREVTNLRPCEVCAADRFLPPFNYTFANRFTLEEEVTEWMALCDDSAEMHFDLEIIEQQVQNAIRP